LDTAMDILVIGDYIIYKNGNKWKHLLDG
jgi:hypothetical protein